MEKKKPTSPLKAIRMKCLDCCCDSPKEVKLCGAKNCEIYPFRFGENPYRKKRILTEEQKELLAKNLAISRGNSIKGVRR